jgi:hypothetical protein
LDRWIKPWDFLRFFVVLYQEIYMMIPILAKKKKLKSTNSLRFIGFIDLATLV